ncbi:MAG: gamma-glutamyl-gamma-aminobutyrate hydrolase family protein [Chloroflexota bacterium]|nr:gamma-glutamyl-gamma-aminobutyrate hydrolase family protein [Chloroflexota bacterium]
MTDRPRIVVTLHGPEQAALEEPTWATFDNYLVAVHRAGGDPVPLDPTSSPEERFAAFAVMDGLLLPGGADLDPGLYGEERHHTSQIEAVRDDLELEAWQAARRQGVPVLGVCRGFQAINVFSGGTLIQHLEGHDTSRVPAAHPLHLDPGSRLAAILGDADPMITTEVNSYHHQAVRPEDLAPGLVATGLAPHNHGDLVEALEAADPTDWLLGVQCHPERSEFMAPEFDRLWRAFVDAARVSSGRRRRS